MIADLKAKIASGDLDTKEEIEAAIEEAAEKYDLKLSEEDKGKILALLDKLKNLDLDWDSIASQAEDWANQLKVTLKDAGVWNQICAFFQKLLDAIKSFFS